MVHVDDVARAQIFLFEHPEAKGRYNCSSLATTVKNASELLSTKYPELQKPKEELVELSLHILFHISEILFCTFSNCSFFFFGV